MMMLVLFKKNEKGQIGKVSSVRGAPQFQNKRNLTSSQHTFPKQNIFRQPLHFLSDPFFLAHITHPSSFCTHHQPTNQMNNSPTSQRSKKRIRIDESANTKHGHTVNLHNDPDMSG
jgi:hypothetical protein